MQLKARHVYAQNALVLEFDLLKSGSSPSPGAKQKALAEMQGLVYFKQTKLWKRWMACS
jgi:hypothetical protein